VRGNSERLDYKQDRPPAYFEVALFWMRAAGPTQSLPVSQGTGPLYPREIQGLKGLRA
jgi:hypothetical protein